MLAAREAGAGAKVIEALPEPRPPENRRACGASREAIGHGAGGEERYQWASDIGGGRRTRATATARPHAPEPPTLRSELRFSRENRCDRQPDIGMRAELGGAGIAVIGATAHVRSPLGGSPRKELPGHLRHHSRVHAVRSRHPRVGCRCAGLGLFCLQTGNDTVSRCSGSQLALARSPGPPATLGRRSTGSKVIRWRGSCFSSAEAFVPRSSRRRAAESRCKTFQPNSCNAVVF